MVRGAGGLVLNSKLSALINWPHFYTTVCSRYDVIPKCIESFRIDDSANGNIKIQTLDVYGNGRDVGKTYTLMTLVVAVSYSRRLNSEVVLFR